MKLKLKANNAGGFNVLANDRVLGEIDMDDAGLQEAVYAVAKTKTTKLTLPKETENAAKLVDRASLSECDRMNPTQASGALKAKIEELMTRDNLQYSEALRKFCGSEKGRILLYRSNATEAGN